MIVMPVSTFVWMEFYHAPAGGSLLPQDEIDYPAAADVRAGGAAVVEDVRVAAPGVLQGIAEDRHQGEVAAVVHLLRQCDDRGRVARRDRKPRNPTGR